MAEQPDLSSLKPYLVRAHHEWMVDNGLTPQILVDAGVRDVSVPQDFVNDGSIVLNIAPRAVAGLVLGNDAIEFSARFGGRGFPVHVPLAAVRALFARELGVGVTFPEPEDADAATPAAEGDSGASADDDDEPPPSPSRPTLRVVK